MDNDDRFILLCKKYEQEILFILQECVFEIKNGKAILNFDKKGTLREIEIQHKIRKEA